MTTTTDLLPRVQLYVATTAGGPKTEVLLSDLGGPGGTADFTATNGKLDTLAAKFPAALGQTTKANALNVTLASDYVPPLSPLQAQESRPAADDAAYYATARDGSTRIQLSSLAAGIKTIEIFAIGSNVWFKLGSSTVTATTPSADAATGAPRYLPQGTSVLVSVGSSTHLALNGTGISLPWWLT